MTDRKHLLNSLAVQAMACTALGSTMHGELLDRVSADVSAGGVFADVLSGHENDPGPSAVALRLLGGLHRLVLDGRAPALRRWYPSVGGRWDLLAAWSDIAATARAHRTPTRCTWRWTGRRRPTKSAGRRRWSGACWLSRPNTLTLCDFSRSAPAPD